MPKTFLAMGVEYDSENSTITKVVAAAPPISSEDTITAVETILDATVDCREDCTEIIFPDKREYADQRHPARNSVLLGWVRQIIEATRGDEVEVLDQTVTLRGMRSVFEQRNSWLRSRRETI